MDPYYWRVQLEKYLEINLQTNSDSEYSSWGNMFCSYTEVCKGCVLPSPKAQ